MGSVAGAPSAPVAKTSIPTLSGVVATTATCDPSGDQAGNPNVVFGGAWSTRLAPWPSTIARDPSGSTNAMWAVGLAGCPIRPVATRMTATLPTARRTAARAADDAAPAATGSDGPAERLGLHRVRRLLVDRHVQDDTAWRSGRITSAPTASPTDATAMSMASARPSAIRASSSSVITNGGPSRIVSPSMPSALPVPE